MTAHAFNGFRPAALTFLRALKKNNRRDWFEANRDVFEQEVKAPLRALVEELDVRFAALAPEFVGDPKSSLFRIYRDIRFSKDKSPYKTAQGAVTEGARSEGGMVVGVLSGGVRQAASLSALAIEARPVRIVVAIAGVVAVAEQKPLALAAKRQSERFRRQLRPGPG